MSLPDSNKPLHAQRTIENEQGKRLNIAIVGGSDSPLNLQINMAKGVRKSGIKSRATRGRDTSQESDRLSIAAGKALLNTDDELSTRNADVTKSPSRERDRLIWSPAHKFRASEELVDNQKVGDSADQRQSD